MTIVVDGVLTLLIDLVPTFAQFDDQSVFVQLLIQPRPQRVQHGHCRPNDCLAQVFVNKIVVHSANCLL